MENWIKTRFKDILVNLSFDIEKIYIFVRLS